MAAMDLKAQMDGIYREMPPDRIPWNMAAPPEILVALVDTGWVTPCDAVDLGCGAGNYAVWLATRGFRVTGIDLSPNALALARRRAEEEQVVCRWVASDLATPIRDDTLVGAFDFAYDWEVLHHVFPDDRPTFAANACRMLRDGGRYVSVCFSERDTTFEGRGRYRETHIGTRLYFSSEDEVRALFDPLFDIEALDTVLVEGKAGPHTVIRTLMTRRRAGHAA